MKLIYLTSKRFPSKKADPIYVRAMAEAFAALLGTDFLFLVRDTEPNELAHVSTLSLRAPKHLRTIYYFFMLPWLVVRRMWYRSDTFFYSYDPNLLIILIFWKCVFRFSYHVASDWHQLFADWRDRTVAQHSDYLTTTSKRLKGLLLSRTGVTSEKVLVAYGGVNPQPFIESAKRGEAALRRDFNLPQDKFLLGYFGSFTSLGNPKGIDTMIEALALLDERFMMVFAGGTKQEIDDYTRMAVENGVAKRCIFLCWLSHDKVIACQVAMNALVIPYPDKPHFRDYGFPMKVWECLAAGRPVFYSKLALIGEILEGRGIPFEPGNARALADAILSMEQDQEQAECVAVQNTRDVWAFTWEARAKNILHLFNTKQ